MSEKHAKRHPFVTVILKMIGLSYRADPRAYSLFIVSSLVFTSLLIADLHLVRTLLDGLPLFVEGRIAYRTVLLTILLLGGVNVMDTLANAALNLIYEYLKRTTAARMTRNMAEKGGRLDLIRFESAELYDGIEKAAIGRERGFEAMEEVVFSAIFHGGYFLFLSLYLAWVKPVLILGVFLSFLPVALSRFIRASAFYKAENRTAALRRRFGHYEECLTDRDYFKETRTRGAVPFFRGLYDRTLAAYNAEMWRTEVRTGLIDLGLKVLTLTGYVGLLLTLVYFLLRSEISVGMFGAVYFAMDGIFKWFEELFDRLGSAYTNSALGGNYFDFMELPERTGGAGRPRYDRGIVMEDVSFRYPGSKEMAVDGVSLVVAPGRSVALVGRNGAGKSTLVRLMTGIYLPDEGRVLIGGVDTREISTTSRYRGLSAVFQSYQRFRMTLSENVTIGDPDAGVSNEAERARIRTALDRAGFAPPPGRLTDGADTMLSREFGGTDLSGGEWQRVAVARGLYRTHDMIVLDEPTASIDPFEETALYHRFVEAARGRTAVIVTHRLGSARIADKIVVMDGGRIAEEGTHEELMRARGHYARMFEAQAGWYRGGDGRLRPPGSDADI